MKYCSEYLGIFWRRMEMWWSIVECFRVGRSQSLVLADKTTTTPFHSLWPIELLLPPSHNNHRRWLADLKSEKQKAPSIYLASFWLFLFYLKSPGYTTAHSWLMIRRKREKEKSLEHSASYLYNRADLGIPIVLFLFSFLSGRGWNGLNILKWL